MAQNVVSMENFHYQWFLATKKDGAKNAARNKNGAKKHSEYIKGIRLKICRRAKNYGAIRQAG